MSELLVRDLRERIARREVVVLVGAGVSMGASAGAEVASWRGLLEDGVGRCEQVVAGLPEGWGDLVRDELAMGEFFSVAEKVTERLGGREEGEYGRWLRETVGQLPLTHAEVIEALQALELPLATTNYDGLLTRERAGWETVTWMDGARVLNALRGEDQAVVHLHGYWRRPESVVLGIRSYAEVLGDAPTQNILHALTTFPSLLLVGFGAGLADANFGALRRWMREALAGAEHRHFRLVHEGERAAVEDEHRDDPMIHVLSYGPDRSALAPFLLTLRATPAATPSSGGPGGEPPASAGPLGLSALPARPNSFGREGSLEELVAALLLSRPTAVLGPPGIGKSNLCLSALHDRRLVERFGARRFFVRCDGALGREALLGELGAALGVVLGPDLAPRLGMALAAAPTALVLDNAETPWRADTEGTEELLGELAAIEGLALVVAVRGEQRPMGPGWGESVHLRPLPSPPARQLFLAVAGQRYAADAYLGELLEDLDGLPIAIELLAYRAQGEPDLADLRALWQERRTDLLHRGTGDRAHLSVATSFELSIEPLEEGPERLLSLLALLPDGVAHPDLDELLDGGREAAGGLRKAGLAFDEAERLRVLKPIRDHVAHHRPPQAEHLEPVFAHYCMLAALGREVGGPEGQEVAERLLAEAGNLEAIVALALGAEDPIPAIEAALGIGEWARLTGAGIGADQLLEAAAAAARAAEDPLREADCINGRGGIELARSDNEAARARYEEALPLYRQVGDVLGEAECIQGLGDIALARSDHEAARACYQEALPLHRQVGDVLGEANCIQSLGAIAIERSEHEGAEARYEEALLLYRQVGSVLGQAGCIQFLGQIELARSEHEAARARYEEALLLFRRVGDVLGAASCIWGLGNIALERSEYETAAVHYEEALLLYRQVGSVLGEANCIQGLGDIALERSEHEAARARYEEALALYERIAEPYSIGTTHRRLARIAPAPAHWSHVEAARTAWEAIERPDLVKELEDEFGSGDPELPGSPPTAG